MEGLMDLRQLKYFVTVAEALSFVRAAERLHMSQPPLSQQIKALEDELGVQLLHRTRREVKLTDAGRVFLAEARDLLERAASLAHRTQQAAGGEEAVLRVAMATSALFHVLPRFLERMASRLPRVTLTVTDMNSDEQVRSLAADKIDLGFIHARPDIRGLERLTVLVDTFAVVLPERHPLARRAGLQLRDLEAEPVVAFSREHAPALFDALIASCQRESFSPRIAHVARHPASLLQLVRLGLGVSIVPRSYADDSMPGLVFHRIPQTAGRLQIDAIWRARNPASGLRRVIDDVLRGLPHDDDSGRSDNSRVE
jgi:DNA-binding transcriptional LysR family regulator